MSEYFDEFFDPPGPRVPVRGGKRAHAGRRGKNQKIETPKAGATQTDYQRYEAAKADKEEQLARQAKVKADLEEGEVVSREAVKSACAKAFSQIAQTLRALPDSLERQVGLAPELCEKISVMIDAAMHDLSRELEALAGEDE